MTIFENDKFALKMKLVGTHVPKEDAHKLSLYCLLESTPRSKIFKDLIDSFLKDLPTLEKLIKLTSKAVLKDWDKILIKNKSKIGWKTKNQIHKKYDKYKITLKENLSRKKIPENIINEIIKLIGNYEKN